MSLVDLAGFCSPEDSIEAHAALKSDYKSPSRFEGVSERSEPGEGQGEESPFHYHPAAVLAATALIICLIIVFLIAFLQRTEPL